LRIHDTLQPLMRTPRALKELMEDRTAHLGDGGFARVLRLSPARVVKLTSCAASIALLDELYAQQQERATASALPVVFRRFGPLAEDADGIRFHGYELERLFPPGQLDAMREARSCPEDAPKQRRQQQPVRYGNQAYWRFERLRRRIQQAQARHIRGEAPAWQECLNVAGELASERDSFAAEVAFGWLERFIERHRVELDLLAGGNVLLSAWGSPVLADPVAVMAFEPVPQDEAPVAGSGAEQNMHALLVERVQSIRGANARLQWHTAGQFDSQEIAQARAKVLLASDVRCVRTQVAGWRSETHRRLMQDEAEREVAVWSLQESVRQAVLRDVRMQVRRTDPEKRASPRVAPLPGVPTRRRRAAAM